MRWRRRGLADRMQREASSGTGPLSKYLGGDHERLGRLLQQCSERPATAGGAAYNAFRAGLLRHIGIEEKLLFPVVRRLGDASTVVNVVRLHKDHAALAALLVPTPTPQIMRTIKSVLAEHNGLEEADGGLYEICDGPAADELRALVERVRNTPEARVAPHYDSAKVHENIRILLSAADQLVGAKPDLPGQPR